MLDNDQYFTQTIVGAPQTVLLGARVSLPKAIQAGMQINLQNGKSYFVQAWHDWVALHRHDLSTGLPQRRPGALLRWLNRHALLIGGIGFTFGLAALALAIGLGLRQM